MFPEVLKVIHLHKAKARRASEEYAFLQRRERGAEEYKYPNLKEKGKKT